VNKWVMNRVLESLPRLLDEVVGDKGEAKLKIVQEIADTFEVSSLLYM